MRKTIRPPKGYRLLQNGEVIREDDHVFLPWVGWIDFATWFGERWNAEEYYPTARKIVKARKGRK